MCENSQTEALALLLREHREVETHLEAARGWISILTRDGAAAVDKLADDLRRFGKVIEEDLALHIAHEDKALFPVLARYIGDQTGPIAVMLLEHRHLEGQERKFEEGLKNREPRTLAESASSIVQVLTAHINKEERILFPLAQRALNQGDWEEVLGLIQTSS